MHEHFFAIQSAYFGKKACFDDYGGRYLCFSFCCLALPVAGFTGFCAFRTGAGCIRHGTRACVLSQAVLGMSFADIPCLFGVGTLPALFFALCRRIYRDRSFCRTVGAVGNGRNSDNDYLRQAYTVFWERAAACRLFMQYCGTELLLCRSPWNNRCYCRTAAAFDQFRALLSAQCFALRFAQLRADGNRDDIFYRRKRYRQRYRQHDRRLYH